MPSLLVWLLLAAATETSGYPLDGLAETVRPGVVAQAEKRLGVALGDLPLYELDLAVDDTTGTFEGRLTLHYRNLTGRPLPSLPLLLHPNMPQELGARPGDQTGSLTILDAKADQGPRVELSVVRPSVSMLRFTEPVAPMGRVRIQVRFRGSLRPLPSSSNDVFEQAMSMMGAVGPGNTPDYGLLGRGDGIVTLASPMPLIAPWRDGAFELDPPARVGDLETHEVANFRMRLVLPKGVKAVSDLVQQPPKPTPDGSGEVTLAAGALRRELVLVASREFAQQSCQSGATRVVSTYLARDAKAGKAVLDAGCGSLAAYEKLFGPYPYPQLDLAEATLVGGAGGAEFSGMALIAGMLYRPPEQSQSRIATMMRLMSTLSSQLNLLGGEEEEAAAAPKGASAAPALNEMLRFTTAHEVAHQYFTGLVGNDSLRDAVLDEPLAQYAAGRFIEMSQGAEAARQAMQGNVRMNYALYRVLGGVDGPANRPTAGFRSAMEYAALVYGKAPYLYMALRKKLGDPRFDRCLRSAIEASAFKRIETGQWVGALETACGGGVRELARRYFDEAHGDLDLKVDPNGDEVVAQIFGPDVAEQLKTALEGTGMTPRDLLRSLLGGGLGEAGSPLPLKGFDPTDALEGLQ